MEEKFEGIDKRKWFCPWCGVAQYYEETNPVVRGIPTEEDK